MLKKKIVLSLLLVLCTIIATAQSTTISGRVTSSDNIPLSDARVKFKNSKITTKTSNDGSYSISVPTKESNVLVFTYVGIDVKEIAVGNLTIVDISLIEIAKDLTDVVVVGCGKQKKRDVTGSVASFY